MKNIEFENATVKGNYKTLINVHRGLSGIILMLLNDTKPLLIKNIINNEYGVQLVLSQSENVFNIYLDFLKKKIYLEKPGKLYQEVYDDYPRRIYEPDGYYYHNNERSITKKAIFQNSIDKEKVHHYELNENGNHYVIIIKNINTVLDDEKIIVELLNRKTKYNTVRDVFIAINEILDINVCSIRIADSKGSNVDIRNGKINQYIEYKQINNEYQKIYLDNDKFYIERKIKEEYQDNLTKYIKKLGENHGKEKR